LSHVWCDSYSAKVVPEYGDSGFVDLAEEVGLEASLVKAEFDPPDPREQTDDPRSLTRYRHARPPARMRRSPVAPL
jgi:hypothetical protein